MLKTLKTSSSIKSPNTNPSTATGQVNANFNNDEIDVFRTLIDCTNDISKLRQFIFYVGTSCDNKNLRTKLKQLQEKLFQNILKQKDSISYFFRRSITTRTGSQTQISKFRESELIRFTLTTLSYYEALIQRLIHLTSVYPLEEKIELVVNLGFEDSAVEDNEEVFTKNEIKEAVDSASVHHNSEKSYLDKREICFVNDTIEFRSCLKMVQNLIEDIEQMDVNLLRFNIKTNETNDFFKNLKEMNKSNTRVRHAHRHNSLNSKDSSDEEGGNNAASIAAKKKKHNSIKSIKNSAIKEFCNRRKIIYSILIIGLMCCVIAVICGLVFGLKQ